MKLPTPLTPKNPPAEPKEEQSGPPPLPEEESVEKHWAGEVSTSSKEEGPITSLEKDPQLQEESQPSTPPKGRKHIEIMEAGSSIIPATGVVPSETKLPLFTNIYLYWLLLLNLAGLALGAIGYLKMGGDLSFFRPLLFLEAAGSIVNLAAVALLILKKPLGFWLYTAGEVGQSVALGILSFPGPASVNLMSLPLLILVGCIGRERGLIHHIFNPDGTKAIPSLSTPALLLLLGLVAGAGFLPNKQNFIPNSSKLIGLKSEVSDKTGTLTLVTRSSPLEKLKFWSKKDDGKVQTQAGQIYLSNKNVGNLLLTAYPRGNNSGSETELKTFREDIWWKKLYTHKLSPMKWGSNPVIAYEEMISSPEREVLYSVIQKPNDPKSPFRHEAQWVEVGNGTVPVLVAISYTTAPQSPDLGASIEFGKTELGSLLEGLSVDGTRASGLPKP